MFLTNQVPKVEWYTYLAGGISLATMTLLGILLYKYWENNRKGRTGVATTPPPVTGGPGWSQRTLEWVKRTGQSAWASGRPWLQHKLRGLKRTWRSSRTKRWLDRMWWDYPLHFLAVSTMVGGLILMGFGTLIEWGGLITTGVVIMTIGALGLGTANPLIRYLINRQSKPPRPKLKARLLQKWADDPLEVITIATIAVGFFFLGLGLLVWWPSLVILGGIILIIIGFAIRLFRVADRKSSELLGLPVVPPPAINPKKWVLYPIGAVALAIAVWGAFHLPLDTKLMTRNSWETLTVVIGGLVLAGWAFGNRWVYYLIALAGFAVAVWGGLDLPLKANAYRGKEGYTALAIVLGGLILAGWALQYRKPKKEKKVKHPRHWIFKVLLGIVWTLRLAAVIWTLYVAMLLGSEKHWWEMTKYTLIAFPTYWAGTLVYVLVQYLRDLHAHDHHATHSQVAGWVLNLSRYWLWLGYIIAVIALIVCLGAIGTHAYFQDWYWLAVSTTLACIVGWLISDKMIRQAENRVLTRQHAFAPDSHH